MATEAYGVSAIITKSEAQKGVDTATRLYFFGSSQKGDLNKEYIITSSSQAMEELGCVAGDGYTLTDAVVAAFQVAGVSQIRCIPVSHSKMPSKDELLGSDAPETGVYTYQRLLREDPGVVNLLCAPRIYDGDVLMALNGLCNDMEGIKSYLIYDVTQMPSQIDENLFVNVDAVVGAKQMPSEYASAVWGDVIIAGGVHISGAAVRACRQAVSDADFNAPARVGGNLALNGVIGTGVSQPVTFASEDLTVAKYGTGYGFISRGQNIPKAFAEIFGGEGKIAFEETDLFEVLRANHPSLFPAEGSSVTLTTVASGASSDYEGSTITLSTTGGKLYMDIELSDHSTPAYVKSFVMADYSDPSKAIRPFVVEIDSDYAGTSLLISDKLRAQKLYALIGNGIADDTYAVAPSAGIKQYGMGKVYDISGSEISGQIEVKSVGNKISPVSDVNFGIDADQVASFMDAYNSADGDHTWLLGMESVEPLGVKATLRKEKATELSADGICSVINRYGTHYTWCDHTSAVANGTVADERARFENQMRMLILVCNWFILTFEPVIDDGMDLQLRNDIISATQTKLNSLVAIGALIGDPKVTFEAASNTNDQIALGHFVFDIRVTGTIPVKHLVAKVRYSDEGLSIYSLAA